MCVPGEPVDLRPEPNNPADPRAIAVYSTRNIQIGYIRAERAQLLRAELARGEVTSIFQQQESWGATIRVGLRGEHPTLPDVSDPRSADWPPPGSHDPRLVAGRNTRIAPGHLMRYKCRISS